MGPAGKFPPGVSAGDDADGDAGDVKGLAWAALKDDAPGADAQAEKTGQRAMKG